MALYIVPIVSAIGIILIAYGYLKRKRSISVLGLIIFLITLILYFIYP